MSDDVTLLPCPFCGGEASIRGNTQTEIRCDNDQCISAGAFNDFGHRAYAITAWNTRTPSPDSGERMREAGEAHRLACVLRIAQAQNSEHGEDMIRAAGMLDRHVYLPAITRSDAVRSSVIPVYCVTADTHSETTGSQWLVGTFPTADEASAAAIAERAAKPDCETTIYLGSINVPALQESAR